MIQERNFTKTIIRSAQPADLGQILELVRDLATFHGDMANTTLANLERDIFGMPPWLPVLVAELNERVAGYVALYRVVQIQFGTRGMDMHHLIVRQDLRGRGIGGALITAARNEARAQGCDYMMVGTHRDNHAAQKVYLRSGFEAVEAQGPRFKSLL